VYFTAVLAIANLFCKPGAEQTVQYATVRACVWRCVLTITFKLNDLWPRHFTF